MAVRQQQQQVFGERKDMFCDYSDEEMIKRCQLDRDGILEVTDLVRDAVQRQTWRNMVLPPELKADITLGYLATGKM